MKLKEKYNNLTKRQKVFLIVQIFFSFVYFIQMIDLMLSDTINTFESYAYLVFTYLLILLFIYKGLPLFIKWLKGVFSGFKKKEKK